VLVCLPFAAEVWRIPADVGHAAFIIEVDLRLVERRVKQVTGV
jgi:hypothetical protein